MALCKYVIESKDRVVVFPADKHQIDGEEQAFPVAVAIVYPRVLAEVGIPRWRDQCLICDYLL